jgi:hypothetical protein
MFAKRKNENELLDMAMSSVPQGLSEEMIRRDNFFHNCWMLLKHRRRDLSIELQEVELIISGYEVIANVPDEDEKDDKKGIVL